MAKKFLNPQQPPIYCPYCGIELEEENEYQKLCPNCNYKYYNYYKLAEIRQDIIDNLQKKVENLEGRIFNMSEGIRNRYIDDAGHYADWYLYDLIEEYGDEAGE